MTGETPPMSKLLYAAPRPHHHGADLGMATTGSYARCFCGVLLIYRGSPGGIAGWWPATIAALHGPTCDCGCQAELPGSSEGSA